MRKWVALAFIGVSVSACSSSWLPSGMRFDLGSLGSGGAQADLRIETEPAGAEARTSTGATCRTPCVLSVAASGEFTVTISAPGFQTQTIPVRPRPPEDPRPGEGGAIPKPEFTPNPVLVQLEPTPPPPAAKRKPAAKKKAAAEPVPQRPAAAAPAATTPWPTQAAAPAPWPSR